MKINVKAAKNAWMFALLKCLKWLMGNPPRLMQKNVLAVKAALRFVKSAQSPSKKPDQTASLALNQVPGKLFFQSPPFFIQEIFLPSQDTATRIRHLMDVATSSLLNRHHRSSCRHDRLEDYDIRPLQSWRHYLRRMPGTE